MNSTTRTIAFAISDSGQATLVLPEPLTLQTIEALERSMAEMTESLRTEALAAQHSREAGAIEYGSWAIRA